VYALAIGGLDPSGAAGLIVDILTLQSYGLHAQAVATALTVQSLESFLEYSLVPGDVLRRQLELLFEKHAPSVVKIGMLGGDSAVHEVVRVLESHGKNIPVVLDPIARSSSGHDLITEAGWNLMRDELLPRCSMVTPNRMEAERLAGMQITDPEGVGTALKRIFEMGAAGAVVTGGHFEGDATDYFYDGNGIHRIEGPRIQGSDVRGTGCMYSSALAACLALGKDPIWAVRQAKKFVTEAIGSADENRGAVRFGSMPKPWQFGKS
jgi:hydroxymethylpyrimidine/phosphomethylpyrimidine kinase